VTEEAAAAHHALTVVENVVEVVPAAAEAAVSGTPLLAWLLKRVRAKGPVDAVKGYAAEVLAVLMQVRP
jgi:hypothetical protein